MITRASPVELRKALQLANIFVRAGIRFVPMPVLDDAEHDRLAAECMAKLDQIEAAAEQGEKK